VALGKTSAPKCQSCSQGRFRNAPEEYGSRRCRTCEVGPVEAEVKRAHVSVMTGLRFVLAVVLAAALTVGCTSTGTTGGGGNSPKGSRGGGWENFRAEAPMLTSMPGSMA
jgi:hypothetical protein